MGISVWQLLIILAIVLLLFGAKRLRSLGTDLGASVKGFREAIKDGERESDKKDEEDGVAPVVPGAEARVIEGKDGVIEGEVVKEKNRV